MKIWQATLFALGAAMASAAVTDARQEMMPAYPASRTWDIGQTRNSSLSVFDTAGVCIYVLNNTWDRHGAIAAVSKAQLPKGAGCQ